MKWLTVLLGLVLVSVDLAAATWYAAADGTSTNGSFTAPWSPFYAVTNTNPHLAGGDTVLFRDGTFTCTETNVTLGAGKVLEFRKAGTGAASRITYQAQNLWGFSFNGGLLIPEASSNLVVRNFHIYSSGITDRTRDDQYEHPSGIITYAPNVDLLHNLIENTGHPGIASWKTTQGKYIAGNVIRFVGYNDNTPGNGGEPRGSGMYLQNQDNSAEALVAGNISYYNYTTGMKAYGNTDIWNFRFYQNVAALCNEAGIFYHLDSYASVGVNIHTNFMWDNFDAAGVRLGYQLGVGGSSNAVVTGNYVVAVAEAPTPAVYNFTQVDGWSYNTYSNNTAVKLGDRYLWSMELAGETMGNLTSHFMGNNTYWSTNGGGFGANPFYIMGTNKSLATWQSTLTTDTSSTHTYGAPTSLVSYVFRPSTDTNFVHAVVFNWPSNATTTVDLSSHFATGSTLKLYDAQNAPTAYASQVYGGGTVTLNLALTNRATMLGTFADLAIPWGGFDPRFRAFVIYRDTGPYINAATANVGTIQVVP